MWSTRLNQVVLGNFLQPQSTHQPLQHPHLPLDQVTGLVCREPKDWSFYVTASDVKVSMHWWIRYRTSVLNFLILDSKFPVLHSRKICMLLLSQYLINSPSSASTNVLWRSEYVSRFQMVFECFYIWKLDILVRFSNGIWKPDEIQNVRFCMFPVFGSPPYFDMI